MMPGGRPPFEITPEVIARTEKLAAQGLTRLQIARVLGICYQTLNEKTKEYTEFSDAIENGRAKGVAKVSNSLFDNAIGGNFQAQAFYLKNRDPDNWEDVQKRKITGGDGGPVQSRIVFNPVRNDDN